jgi:hypothetical protein
MNNETKTTKPKGRKPHSKSTAVATVRFKTPEQYQQVAAYARDVKGMSVNAFCTSLILAAIKPRESGYEFINAEIQSFVLTVVYKRLGEDEVLHRHHPEKLYNATDGDIRRIVKNLLSLTAEEAKLVKVFRLGQIGENNNG